MTLKIKSLYYAIYGLYISTFFLSYTCIYLTNNTLIQAIKMVRYLCYGFFILKIILDLKKSNNFFPKLILFAILSLIVYFFTSHRELFLLAFLLFAYKDMDIKKMIRITYKIYSVLFTIIVILSVCNIIPDWTYMRGDIVRHSLGFQYTTIAIGCFLTIVLMAIYIKQSSIKTWEIYFLECINLILYYYTNGRLSFLLITFILLICILVKMNFVKKIFYSKMFQSFCNLTSKCLPLVLFVCVIFLAKIYSPNYGILEKIDQITSNRISLTHDALVNNEIRLFGKNIEWRGYGGFGYVTTEYFIYNYVDTAYVRILLDYGIILTIVVLVLYTKLLNVKWKEKKYYEWFIICSVLIWGLLEPYLFNVGRNVFILEFMIFMAPQSSIEGEDKSEGIIEKKLYL